MDKLVVRGLWVAGILLVLWQSTKFLEPYMLSIQGALIFSALLYPFYKKLANKTKKAKISALLIMLLLVIIILLPLGFISVSLVNQASGLRDLPTEYVDNVEDQLASYGIDVDIEGEGARFINNIKIAIFSNLVDLVGRLTDFLINGFIFFFLLYYLLVNGPAVIAFISRYLPFDDHKNRNLLIHSNKIIKAVFYGSVLTASIQGILGGIGFAIFGVDKALFWGFVMAILSILPFFGSWLIWGPGVLYLFAIGNTWQAIGLALWGLIIVSQSDNIIKPQITSRMGKVHPVVILLGVFIGLALFGVIGLLSGPILLGLLVLVIQFFHEEKNPVLQAGTRKTRK